MMKETGILLIHGFAGSRDEVLPIFNFLQACGYSVEMPVLSGHEGTFKELSISTYKEWIYSAEKAYLNLLGYKSIVVIGFSMGGLIAINLYNKYNYNKLITINTPVYYWDLKKIIANLKSDYKVYFKKYFKASIDKPIRSLIEFQKLLLKTKPLIKDIKCDAFVIQAQDDDTVNKKSADYLYNNIQGKKCILKREHGGHQLFQSSFYNDILIEIGAFIDNS